MAWSTLRGAPRSTAAGARRDRGRNTERRSVFTRRAAGRVARRAIAVDGTQHPRRIPGRRSALRVPARRASGPGRRERLGHQHGGVRVVLPVRHLRRHARWRAIQLLLGLVPAGDGQRRDSHLQVGDIPDPGTARMAGDQQGSDADWQRRCRDCRCRAARR